MMQINNIKLPSKKRERERATKIQTRTARNLRLLNHIEQLEVLVRQYGHKRYNQVKKSPL